MKKIFFLFFGLAVLLLSFSDAKADFNNSGTKFTDWSTSTNTSFSSSSSTTSSSLTNKQICERIFNFQKDNVLQGTFCDLIAIASVAAADFSTNVSCTIQKVGMTNYDNQIQFSSPFSNTNGGPNPANLCAATNVGSTTLKPSIAADIFGSGRLLGNSTTKSGIYQGTNLTQVSSDLQPDLNLDKNVQQKTWVNQGFKVVRGISMAVGLVILFLIAFANILHLDINTYTVKRMIPNLIIALIGGYLAIYFIFLISRGVDFLYQLEIFSPYNTVHPFYNILGGGANLQLGDALGSGQDMALAAQQVIFNVGNTVIGAGAQNFSLLSAFMGMVFLFIPAIVVFAFEYVLALRPIAIGILTVISPIAFACYVLPQTQNLFRKWWALLLIALFYTPVVNFIFYILNLSSPTNGTASGLAFMLSVIVKSGVIIFLIRLPFTIESDIKKISLAIQKSSLTASLGLSKAAIDAKTKEQNKVGTVTDKALQSKDAKSIIAPVNRNITRETITNKQETSSMARSFAQIVNRNNPANVKEVEAISAQAHKINLSRPSAVLVSSTSDIRPQTFRKVLNSSNQTIFRETNAMSELKNKNGQLLDNQGAIVRADAVRKVAQLAKVVNQDRIAHPDAVRSLAQKGMLDVLPLETLKLSLQQGIVNPNDLRVSFKDPQAAYDKIVNFRRGVISQNSLNEASLKVEMEKDHLDATSGYTDIRSVIQTNATNSAPLAESSNQTFKVVETLRSQNQNYFDQNAPYFIQRLQESNKNSRIILAKTMETAGTPAKTATAIAQNPNLPIEQIRRYLPPNASPEVQRIVREQIGTRDITQNAIGQISKAFKEDKSVLGKTVAEKVSQTMRDGRGQGLDDIKNQLVQSVKTLSSNPNPETAKKAMSEISSFAPGVAISGGTTPSANDIEKTKEKGEQVISAIDDMKTAGVEDEVIKNNPNEAAKQYDEKVNNQVQSIISGEAKGGKSIESQVVELSKKKPTAPEQVQNESTNVADPIDQDVAQKQQQAASTLSSKTNNGKNFDEQIQDLTASKPEKI